MKKIKFNNIGITIIMIICMINNTVISQSLNIDATDVQQRIEIMGGDIVRSQFFTHAAANPQDVVDWSFKDINFNLCRVGYDKKQEIENRLYYVEGASISSVDDFSKWELIESEERYYIHNASAYRNIQCLNNTIDDGEGKQIYATGGGVLYNSTKWELIPVENDGDGSREWYYLRSANCNYYLQCIAENSQTSGHHIRGVATTETNETTQWSFVDTGLGDGSVYIENRGNPSRLRFTAESEVVKDLSIYDDAVSTMQMIKEANPNIKFLATMRSDYHGYKSDNHNNLPEFVYNYSCLKEGEDGKSCDLAVGDKSFNSEAYARFLADYLEHMHNNGVTIAYLAPVKEWSSIVTAERSHEIYENLLIECASRVVPMPGIIGPATWGINGGTNVVKDVIEGGWEDEYHSFSTHNLSSNQPQYVDFMNTVSSVNKMGWNDETYYSSGGRTNGEEVPVIENTSNWISKSNMYSYGLSGECIFAISSRSIGAETRAIYHTNGSEAYRMRSYYQMKNYANNILNKYFVPNTVASASNVTSLAVSDGTDMFIMLINNGTESFQNFQVNVNNASIAGSIEGIKWVDEVSIEGETRIIETTNTSSFLVDVPAESIQMFKLQTNCGSSHNGLYVKINNEETWSKKEDVVTFNLKPGDALELGPRPLNQNWTWYKKEDLDFSSVASPLKFSNIKKSEAGTYEGVYNNNGCLSRVLVTINVDDSLCGSSYYSVSNIIQAEDYCEMLGVKIQNGADNDGTSIVGFIENGDWIKFSNVDFSAVNVNYLKVRASSDTDGGMIKVLVDDLENGQQIAEIDIQATETWDDWESFSSSVATITGTHDVYFKFEGANGYLLNLNHFEFLEEPSEVASFVPNPNKTYYIDVPYHNLRLASTGESEDAYTTSTNTTGADVEWRFVQKDGDYWHVQRAQGGTMPRLRTDSTEFADMQSVDWEGVYTYYEFTEGYMENTYFLTLPNAPVNYQRLQVTNNGTIKFVPTSHALTWESFSITEVGSFVDFSRIEAEDFDTMSGIQTEESTESGENVGYINNGDWIRFDNVNLSGANSVVLRVASETAGGTIELRTGSATGTLIGSVNVSNTGEWQNWNTISTSVNNTSGTQEDIYLVFKGEGGYLFNVNWLEFSGSFISAKSIDGKITNGESVIIYPNPVDATTNIQGAQSATLEVYDMKGSLLLTKNISSDIEEINLSNFSSGIYYAKVSSTQSVEVIKIIKQ